MTTVLVYQSKHYVPDLVTGRYVRCAGSKRKGYHFRVFETATGRDGTPGHGPTLREYDTSGDEIPDDIRQRAIISKATMKWPL